LRRGERRRHRGTVSLKKDGEGLRFIPVGDIPPLRSR
jgi:hypothetical protein